MFKNNPDESLKIKTKLIKVGCSDNLKLSNFIGKLPFLLLTIHQFVRIGVLSDYGVIGNTSDFGSDISGSSPDGLTLFKLLLFLICLECFTLVCTATTWFVRIVWFYRILTKIK